MGEHIEKLRLYRGEMSRADVLRAVECIDRNANELFEDARLLFDNGRYARALSLMLLAFEERTKAMLPVLYYSQQREPKSRTSFWKLYRSHNIKLEALFRLCGLWMLLTKEPLLENEVEWAAVQSDIFNLGGRYAEVATQANLVKQGGFYADCYEVEGVGVWTAPSDYYNNSAAKERLGQLLTSYSSLIHTDANARATLMSFAKKAIAAIDQDEGGSSDALDKFTLESFDQALEQLFEYYKQRAIENLKDAEAE